MSAPADSFDEIATLRIELEDSDPLIWREVDVPTSVTLKTLHAIIQAAMGWLDYHLWEFTIGKRRYGPPADEDEDWGTEPVADAGKARLRGVLGPRKTAIGYIYDFGDCWELRLTVSRIRAGDPNLSYPRYVAGERNGPPEDSGGIPGFYAKLDAAADPEHRDHADIVEWLGAYDPNKIDEAAIKHALAGIAVRRRRVKAGSGKRKPPSST